MMDPVVSVKADGAYWEPKVQSRVAPVAPGAFAVTDDRELALTTLLGSCIAACICDPVAQIGGLNHFLLPDKSERETAQNSLRYGVHAMEMLINELLKLGAARARLQAKLFGGASVIALSQGDAVGDRNARFAEDFLRKERIPLLATDTGGVRARRIYFRPSRNEVLVQMPRIDVDDICAREETVRRRAQAAPKSGGVELF